MCFCKDHIILNLYSCFGNILPIFHSKYGPFNRTPSNSGNWWKPSLRLVGLDCCAVVFQGTVKIWMDDVEIV